MTGQPEASKLLRRPLQANAAFAGASGLVLIGAADPLATLLGVAWPWLLRAIGLSILLYGAGLLRNAAHAEMSRLEAWLAVLLDVAWVAGSGLVLPAGTLTTTGSWLVAIVAQIVALFAVLQAVGLRRVRSAWGIARGAPGRCFEVPGATRRKASHAERSLIRLLPCRVSAGEIEPYPSQPVGWSEATSQWYPQRS